MWDLDRSILGRGMAGAKAAQEEASMVGTQEAMAAP
jgi:hypothetical protein